MSTKKIFKKVRVIVLLVFLLFALIAINPSPFKEGVTIRSIGLNSSASLAGIQNPNPKLPPLSKEYITKINDLPIRTTDEFSDVISNLEINSTVYIETNKGSYSLKVRPLYKELNETETRIVEVFNESTNRSMNKSILVHKKELIGAKELGIKVSSLPSSNIRKGLDLVGGTRVLLKPEDKVSSDDLQLIIDNLQQRLNAYGVSDVIIKEATSLNGDKFIQVEIAGATEDEVKDLISSQGKFEARIGNKTVFIGGEKDITYVCNSAECSGIDPRRGCSQTENNQWACSFFFTITLSKGAAGRQAEATRKLDVITENGQQYLSESLALILDDKEVDSLKIGADLKGRTVSDIQISGSGTGITEQEAMQNSIKNMKSLRSIMSTGSLPTKLDVVRVDTVSPSLGKEFLNNALVMGLLALIAVAVVIFIRYRSLKISIPMLLTLSSEIVLILGFAALIGWNLDLASIAGIIVSVGTGVDDLVVITDETARGETSRSWKKKLKAAMFIVMGAYLTTLGGMVPLWFAGAGLLKGFAFTTIVGISFGVLIARPAYAAIVEELFKND